MSVAEVDDSVMDETKNPMAKVLVVDDDEAHRSVVCRLLELAGHAVVDARSADVALEICDKTAVELVITDLDMPGTDGLALSKRLLSKDRDLPVVMMTGKADLESSRQAVGLGLYDYVLKPFDATDLLAIVGRALRQRRTLRQNRSHQRDLERYHVLFDESRDAIFVLTHDGRFVEANRSTLKLFDCLAEGVIGRNILEFFHLCDDWVRLREEIDGKGSVRDHEVTLRKKGGPSMDCLVTATSWIDHQGDYLGYQGTIRDVTERKRMESQLFQAEKMAGLGQVAAGVAHEINTPIGFVMSNLRTLKEYVGDLGDGLRAKATPSTGTASAVDRVTPSALSEEAGPVLREMGDMIGESLEGVSRVQEIVESLRSFARLDESEYKKANVNDGIEAVLSIVGHEIGSTCNIRKILGAVPTTWCFPGQLNQVFVNLLINAAQAIPEKGEITIETKSTDTEIVIRFQDTGIGIPPEDIPRLFTPFFTTKPVGVGTGLGLSISHGIMQQHEGSIEVESRVGEGSVFTIRLPIVHSPKPATRRHV